jgi:CHAT domain-containing protein
MTQRKNIYDLASIFLLIFSLGVLSIPLCQAQNTTENQEAKQLCQQADSLMLQKAYPQAFEHYSQACKLYKKEKNNAQYWVCLNKMVEIQHKQGNLAEALEISDKSLKKYPKQFEKQSLQKVLMLAQKGDISATQGENQQAIEWYQEALNIWQEETDEPSLETAEIYEKMGLIYQNSLKKQSLAGFYFEQALGIYRTLLTNKNLKTANLFERLGLLYYQLGLYDKALHRFDQSLQSYIMLYGENHEKVATTYNNLGVVYNKQGLPSFALDNYQKALKIWLTLFGENHQEIATAYNNLGAVYHHLELYEKAIEHYQKSLSVIEKLWGENHPQMAIIYNNMGAVFEKQDFNEQALAFYQKALHIKINQLGEYHLEISHVYHNIGSLYKKIKRYDLALEAHQRALMIRKKVLPTHHPDFAVSYHHLGKLYQEQTDYLTALFYLQKALIVNSGNFRDSLNIYSHPSMYNIHTPSSFLNSLQAKAECFASFYAETLHMTDLKTAYKTYLLADSLLTMMRESAFKNQDKLILGKSAEQINRGAMQVCITLFEATKEANYVEKAFYFSERNKSNLLMSSFKEEQFEQYSSIPPSLLYEADKFKKKIIFLEQKTYINSPETEIYRDSLYFYRRIYERIIATFERDYPDYRNFKYTNGISSLQQIQQNLNAQTAIVEYFLDAKNSYVFLITKDTLIVFPILNHALIQNIAEQYYNELQSEARLKRFAQWAYNSYSFLIAPLMPYLKNKKRLIIIPEQSLWYIPFEAFIQKMPEGKTIARDDFDDLSYLLYQFEISYHYAATLWQVKQSQDISSNHPCDFIGFAPYSNLLESYHIDLGLPESGKEVLGIAEMFKRNQLKAQSYIGEKANKAFFLENVHQTRILHLATHSQANYQNDKLAKIAFYDSIPDKRIGHQASLLASEILHFNLKSDLVVLSSCESGTGKFEKGEGIFSLGKTFWSVGAKNVVYSLWNVDDVYAKELMLLFYKEYLNPLHPSPFYKALHTAKLKLIQKEKFLHPKHWSNFVLVGF